MSYEYLLDPYTGKNLLPLKVTPVVNNTFGFEPSPIGPGRISSASPAHSSAGNAAVGAQYCIASYLSSGQLTVAKGFSGLIQFSIYSEETVNVLADSYVTLLEVNNGSSGDYTTWIAPSPSAGVTNISLYRNQASSSTVLFGNIYGSSFGDIFGSSGISFPTGDRTIHTIMWTREDTNTGRIYIDGNKTSAAGAVPIPGSFSGLTGTHVWVNAPALRSSGAAQAVRAVVYSAYIMDGNFTSAEAVSLTSQSNIAEVKQYLDKRFKYKRYINHSIAETVQNPGISTSLTGLTMYSDYRNLKPTINGYSTAPTDMEFTLIK